MTIPGSWLFYPSIFFLAASGALTLDQVRADPAPEHRAKAAVEYAAQAERARDQLLSATEMDVWQAYYDLQTSASSVNSATTLVKSATESAAASAARDKAGVGNLLDFITAQLDDTNARVAQIQSYLDWYSALSRLNFALGASDSAVVKAGAR
jgi:outer membrane protein TolC